MLALLKGERILGRYTVVLLQRNSDGIYSPAVVQLDTTLTNYRIYLRPMHRRYAPAVLPSRLMRRVDLVQKGGYHCVQITFVSGDCLYLILATGKLEDFYDDLNAMRLPPPRFKYDEAAARVHIERLIAFFSR
jgi:hypothetical protein